MADVDDVELPSLRGFLGAIALTKTTSTTPNRSLPTLQGGLTRNDRDVRDVVNGLAASHDASGIGQSAVATLRAADAPKGDRTITHVTGSDGGVFAWDAASTTDDDGGTLVRPSSVLISSAGRHRRLFSGPVDARWFGAAAGSGNVATCAAAINAALAAAAAAGFSVVLLPSGVFYANASLLIPSGVTLKGAGRNSTIIQLHSSAALGEGIVVNTHYSLGNSTPDSHVGIRDLAIDGNSVTPASGQPRGIFFNKCSASLVEDILVHATVAEGIRIDMTIAPAGTPPTCTGNVVRGNIVDRTSLSGDNIMLRSYTNDPTNTGAIATKLLESIVTDNDTIGGSHGITLLNVQGWAVTNNRCRDNGERGIIMSPDATDGVVSGNRVVRAGSTGIHGAYRTRRVAITGNTVSGTVADQSGIGQEGQGIKLYVGFANITIAGNTCEGNATDGIALLGGAPPTTGGDGAAWSIAGNVCYGNSRHGIHVRAGTVGSSPVLGSTPVHSGTITGNTVQSNVSNGIHITTNDGGTTKPENIAVSGNVTRSNGGDGLYADTLLNCNIGPNQHSSNGGLAENVSWYANADHQVSHHVGAARVMFGAIAPTAGTWAVGDRVWNTAPTAGGTMGWVCTTAGTPGTWKTFGAIAA